MNVGWRCFQKWYLGCSEVARRIEEEEVEGKRACETLRVFLLVFSHIAYLYNKLDTTLYSLATQPQTPSRLPAY